MPANKADSKEKHTMEVLSPPGYGKVVPFNKEIHAQMGLAETGRYSFASNLNAVFITVTEFVQAARHYPIVFSANETASEFIPMVVTGLAKAENRFIDDNGNWEKAVYIPAYIRRYPFCVAEVHDEKDTTSQQLVCVDESALSDEAVSFFDENGEPTEAWQQFENFLQDYESSRIASMAFASKLAELDLLEVFEARAKHVSGEEYHMINMYRVDEKKLNKLPAKLIKELMSKNYMYFIYAHLMSLDNFQALLDREKISQA